MSFRPGEIRACCPLDILYQRPVGHAVAMHAAKTNAKEMTKIRQHVVLKTSLSIKSNTTFVLLYVSPLSLCVCVFVGFFFQRD